MTAKKVILSTATVFIISMSDVQGSSEVVNTLSQANVSFSYTTETSISRTHSEDIIKDIKSVPSEFDRLEGEITNYLRLENNWDFENGITPKLNIVKTTLDLLNKIQEFNLPLPRPMLDGDGEISLYWKKDKIYIELSIDKDNLYSYLVDNGNSPYSEDDCLLDTFSKSEVYKALINSTLDS